MGGGGGGSNPLSNAVTGIENAKRSFGTNSSNYIDNALGTKVFGQIAGVDNQLGDTGTDAIINKPVKAIGDIIFGKNPTAPDSPGGDPTADSIKAQQVADSKNFRASLPQTQQSLYENAYKNERQNLASNINGVRNNANSRGLLYSGVEQGSELGQRANSNANLAQTRAEINNSTESQARQLEANAVQSGIAQQQSIASIEDQTMAQALANMTARRQGLASAGSAIGSVAGTYYANQQQNKNPKTTPNGVGQSTIYGT